MKLSPIKNAEPLAQRARRSSSPIAALLFVLLGLFAVQAFAQEATIVGTVSDPTGAAVPNATITVTKTDTGQSHRFNSNNDGQYVAPGLVIGAYTVQVESGGFKPVTKSIVLNVNDRSRMDFKMEVGAAQERITVEATAVQVQSESSEVSQVINGTQVSQLATNGRSIYTLINLTPGSSSNQGDFQTPTPVGGDAAVSFNGQRPSHNIYLMDGGEDLDRGGSGNFSVMPSLESMSEFRALTSNYSAEYGLSSAATMTTVLKSGTKKLHASAWEYLRNDALDARAYFTAPGAPNPELRFNTYGFNVGGPVTLGKLYNSDRSKTFFFYNMEWRSLITAGGGLNTTVPLTSTYGGAFPSSTVITIPQQSQLSQAEQNRFIAAGLGGKWGQQFPNNTIPTSLLDANAQALLKAGIFPAPNNGNKFQGGAKTPTNVREEIVRADHNFNDKFSVFGHFVAEQISQGFGTAQWSGDNVPTIGDTFGNPSYSAVVHASHIINPRLLNEIAFNYNGNRINIIPKGIYTAPTGFTFNRIFTGPNALNRIPSINLSGSSGTNYTVTWEPWVNKADDYQIRDDVSWSTGKHQFKYGGSWALYKKIQDVFAATQGSFGFNGSYTGNDFADFLLGYAQSYSEDAVHDNGYWNNVSWAAYIQDNWRTTPRLTLNLGLRWDGAPHTYEANNRMSNFYPNMYDPSKAPLFANANGTQICAGPNNPTGSGCTAASPGLGTSPNPILQGVQFYLNGVGISGQPGVPHGMVDDHWAQFGPRVGFAYDLTGKGTTVVRAGFGAMYERIQGNDMYNGGTNVPFSASAGLNDVFLTNPKMSVKTGNSLTGLPIVVPSLTGIAKNNYKAPVSYQYSAGVQHALGSKAVVAASYVGSQGRHQNDYREIDLPPASLLPSLQANNAAYNTVVSFPGFRSLKMSENEANAHYNSLQLDVHGNVRKDLMLQFGYTLSRSIDPNGGGDLGNVSNPYLGWRYDVGPSNFDRTHVAFVNFDYQIPFLKNSDNAVLKTMLGGWEMSGIVTMQSGLPLNITQGGSNSVCSIPIGTCTNRPNLTGTISYPQTVSQWFSTNAFTAPAAGTWGNLEHNGVRGPGRDNWNLSMFKNFVFSESRGSRLEFRADAFNAWNHTQFRNVSTSDTASDFGQVTSAFDPRVFQLGMKVVF